MRGDVLTEAEDLKIRFSRAAAYSHLDQKVTRTTDPTTLGKRPPLAPDNLYSLARNTPWPADRSRASALVRACAL